jgi:hypothetical protein
MSRLFEKPGVPSISIGARCTLQRRSTLRGELAAPSIKQRLAATSHLLDWLVTGQVVLVNLPGSVRDPRGGEGAAPVLDPVGSASAARPVVRAAYAQSGADAGERIDHVASTHSHADREDVGDDKACDFAYTS